jgi:hypothetical protein
VLPAPVSAWLEARGARVLEVGRLHAEDAELIPLALELGDHFADLRALHGHIRRSQTTGRQFQMKLGRAAPPQSQLCVGFARKLEEQALLLDLDHDAAAKTLGARASKDGRAHNFFSGGWFELFMAEKIRRLLQKGSPRAELIANIRIETAKGGPREIDLLWWAGDAPVLVECATGGRHVQRLHSLAGALKVPKGRAVLILLEAPPNASEIEEKWNLVVTDRRRFQDRLRPLFEAPAHPVAEAPRAAAAEAPRVVAAPALTPDHLGTYLRAHRLEPSPGIRENVLKQVCSLKGVLDGRKTANDLRLATGEAMPDAPGARLSDIINALVIGGAFLGADKAPVTSADAPIRSLATRDPSHLARLCVRAYTKTILQSAPQWFDDQKGRREFREVVGKRALKEVEVAALRAQIAASEE